MFQHVVVLLDAGEGERDVDFARDSNLGFGCCESYKASSSPFHCVSSMVSSSDPCFSMVKNIIMKTVENHFNP